MQYTGFRAHIVKHEPLALHLLKQKIKSNLQFHFTRHGGCELVNNELKIKTATKLLSIANQRQGIGMFIIYSCTNLKRIVLEQ